MEQETLFQVNDTPLKEPAKVRFPWSLDARKKLCSRQWEPGAGAIEDPSVDDPYEEFLDQLGPAVNRERQKTNVVAKTVGEAEAVLFSANQFYDESKGVTSRTWQTPNHAKAYKRLRNEMLEVIEEQGYTIHKIDGSDETSRRFYRID